MKNSSVNKRSETHFSALLVMPLYLATIASAMCLLTVHSLTSDVPSDQFIFQHIMFVTMVNAVFCGAFLNRLQNAVSQHPKNERIDGMNQEAVMTAAYLGIAMPIYIFIYAIMTTSLTLELTVVIMALAPSSLLIVSPSDNRIKP